jgi:hypothetical protein
MVHRSRLMLVLAIAACGCRKQAEDPHGPPSLIQVVWEVDGVPALVWSRDADAAVAPLVPAAGSRVSFVFDHKLDGARVEDTVDGVPVPKANPPITVSWADMGTTMSDPPFVGDVFYNSLPDWGAGTTYAFMRPRIAGFPSATDVTFSLDPNGITSVYGEPLVGAATVTVTTTPLAVTVQTSTATVSTSYMAPIVFSTRAPAGRALIPFVHVETSGVALPFDIVGDVGDAKRVYVVPSGCLTGWPPNASIQITADPGMPDGFGRPLAAARRNSFMTSPIAGPPSDGGCGFLDAGTTDTGKDDGGGGSTDAASNDAASTANDAQSN